MKESAKRDGRVRDIKKKLRVVIKFSQSILFEALSRDISLSGIFIMAKSPKILNMVTKGMELEFFIENNFDVMIPVKGIVSRIQRTDTDPENIGFALAISEITEKNKQLLTHIISYL